ncbi:MAG: DUF6000 family protein [Acidobacteriota bacterium]
MKNIDEQIKLHSAGATVRHTSLFADLLSFNNDFELSEDFIKTWVIRYYMLIGVNNDQVIATFREIVDEITKEIALKLLGDFNWRTRQTGAFFAAIKNYSDLIDIIGVHLLKSEVCYAGQVYAFILAFFNTPKCVEYLNIYLDYYLTKPDLWFDQTQVMEAVAYLDKVNGTTNLQKHFDNWVRFIGNKSHWNKEISIDWIESQLDLIKAIKN